jgi:hypothetical protein
MLKSSKANGDDLLATEPHQFSEQQIHKIHAAMEAVVQGAEKVSTTKCRQFLVCLNRAQQTATTWSDTDRQKEIEELEHEIGQVTPAICKLLDQLFQCHERKQLQDVGTKVTNPGRICTSVLALRQTATKNEAPRAANITADERLEFQVCISNAETEALTWSLADTEQVIDQLEREIYGITLNEQKRFRMEFSICMVQIDAWYKIIGIHRLMKTIDQWVIHFSYPKRNLWSEILE